MDWYPWKEYEVIGTIQNGVRDSLSMQEKYDAFLPQRKAVLFRYGA